MKCISFGMFSVFSCVSFVSSGFVVCVRRVRVVVLGVGARASLSLAGRSWPGARVWPSHGGPFVGLGSRAACRSCYSFDYCYYFIVRSRRAFAWSIIFFYYNRVRPTATILSSTPCRGGLGFSEFVLYFVGTAAHVHTGYWLSASVGHVCCTAVN